MGSPPSGTDAHSPRDSTILELHHTENYHLTVETSQESPPLGSLQQPGRAWPVQAEIRCQRPWHTEQLTAELKLAA